MKRFFLLIGLICFISLSTHAQIMFQKHYGGSGDEYGSTCLQTSDGGYIVTGSTDSYGLGGRDIYVIKTDEYGNVSWSNTYGGSGDDQSTCIIQAFDGNYLVSGITDSYGAGGRDIYCIKLDQNGDTIWTKTYGGTGAETGFSVIQTSDNGYVISGNTESFSPVTSSIYLIKTNENGDTLWTKTFFKQDVNSGCGLIVTNDNNLLMVATISNNINAHDIMLIKSNMNGDTLWTKVYDKGGNDWVSGVCELSNGDFLVLGRTNSIGYGDYDILLAKYNNGGNEIWFKTFGGYTTDMVGDFKITNDSGIVISGVTSSFGHGANDLYLIKTNLNGDTIWTKTHGGSGDDVGGSVYQTADNGFIIAGYSNSYGNGNEIYLVKTREDGFVNLNDNESASSLISIYPNPCDGNCSIALQNTNSTPVSLQIFDLKGELVFQKDNLFLDCSKERINLYTLRSGMYFLNLYGDDFNESTKLLIQK